MGARGLSWVYDAMPQDPTAASHGVPPELPWTPWDPAGYCGVSSKISRVPAGSRGVPWDPWRSHLAYGGISIHRKSRGTSHENPTEVPRYFPPVFSWDPRSLDIPLTLNPTRYP